MGTRLNPDGAKIRALRTQRGWTQEQLAEIAGVSSRTIQRAETADRAAFETVRAVASAFETEFDQLLRTGAQRDPEPEIVQAAPVPVQAPKLDIPNVVEQSAHPVQPRFATFRIAAAALSAGMLAGGIFIYRCDKRVEPHFPAAQWNSVAPAQTGAGERAAQAGTATGQALLVPGMVLSPAAGTATRDRKVEAAVEPPGDHAPTTQVRETFQPAALPPQTVITSQLPLPAYCDLPFPSRDLQAVVAIPEPLLAWSAHSSLPGSLAQNDEGTGAVRQAMGQATKKTGEFVAKVGASMKRAF